MVLGITISDILDLSQPLIVSNSDSSLPGAAYCRSSSTSTVGDKPTRRIVKEVVPGQHLLSLAQSNLCSVGWQPQEELPLL
jgi:hypothetical protein